MTDIKVIHPSLGIFTYWNVICLLLEATGGHFQESNMRLNEKRLINDCKAERSHQDGGFVFIEKHKHQHQHYRKLGLNFFSQRIIK